MSRYGPLLARYLHVFFSPPFFRLPASSALLGPFPSYPSAGAADPLSYVVGDDLRSLFFAREEIETFKQRPPTYNAGRDCDAIDAGA